VTHKVMESLAVNYLLLFVTMKSLSIKFSSSGLVLVHRRQIMQTNRFCISMFGPHRKRSVLTATCPMSHYTLAGTCTTFAVQI